MAFDIRNEVKNATLYQNISPIKPTISPEKLEQSSGNGTLQSGNTNSSGTYGNTQSDNVLGTGLENHDKQTAETSIKETSKDINKLINNNTVAEFGIYEDTNRVIIKIKDKYTNEIIKEIPSEKAMELLQKAWELAGILVDEKR